MSLIEIEKIKSEISTHANSERMILSGFTTDELTIMADESKDVSVAKAYLTEVFRRYFLIRSEINLYDYELENKYPEINNFLTTYDLKGFASLFARYLIEKEELSPVIMESFNIKGKIKSQALHMDFVNLPSTEQKYEPMTRDELCEIIRKRELEYVKSTLSSSGLVN